MSAADRPDVFYRDYYDRLLSEGNTGRAVAVAHRAIERGASGHYASVLEVGAGSGHHRQYVRHGYDLYVESDLRHEGPPVEEGRVRKEWADAQHLPYPDDAFDRLIATCLVIHLRDPEAALADWRRVVRPGGLITVYVPCEPGWLLRTLRRATTARRASRLGFDDYALTVAREHPGHGPGLDVQLRHVFRGDRLRVLRWPTRLPTWNFNVFSVYHVTKQ